MINNHVKSFCLFWTDHSFFDSVAGCNHSIDTCRSFQLGSCKTKPICLVRPLLFCFSFCFVLFCFVFLQPCALMVLITSMSSRPTVTVTVKDTMCSWSWEMTMNSDAKKTPFLKQQTWSQSFVLFCFVFLQPCALMVLITSMSSRPTVTVTVKDTMCSWSWEMTMNSDAKKTPFLKQQTWSQSKNSDSIDFLPIRRPYWINSI